MLPGRLVVGGYSLDDAGDGPGAGTGLSVWDLRPDDAGGGPRYGRVGHEALHSPTWVVAHPDRPWLLSVGETSPSEVACTRLDDDGRLTVLDRRQTGGDGACHLALSADGRWVLVAHYGSGTVESFALDDEGRLSGPVGRFLSAAPLGPEADRQDAPHAHQVVLDPAWEDELLVCDLGTDRVHRLRLHADGRLGALAPAVVLPPGSGPRHLVVAGDTLVVVCELSLQVWVARRSADGWQHTQTLSSTSRELGDGEEAASVSGVRVAGDLVVVATRGVDTLRLLGLDRATSTLRPVAEVSCQGRHPRDLVVGDRLVWVADQHSDTVVALDLAAAAAGREEAPVVRLAVPRPACVVLLDHGSTTRQPGAGER